MPSANQQKEVVSSYLDKEPKADCIALVGGEQNTVADVLSAKLSQVLRGIQASQPGQPKFVRLPMTMAILGHIKEAWEAERTNSDKVMLWAAMLLRFFGFFCSGEICFPYLELFNQTEHLSFADVSVDSIADPQLISVHSRQIPCQLCPVAAVLAWMVMRGTLMGQPLFYFSDGSTLTRQRFVTELQKALHSNGEYPRAVLGLVPLLLLLSRVLETPPSNCLVSGESQPISSMLRHHHPAWLCTPEPCHSKCPEWQTRLAQVSPDK